MAAELVGGALLSAFLAPLVEKLASEIKDFFKGKDAILKLLKELKTLLSSADLLLIDAEEKLIKDPRVRKWLDDLKDTIYDADDLVYKIDTEAWRNKLEGGDPHESHRGCSCTSKALLRLISSTPLTSFDKNIKPEIEETLGKLKLLLDNKDLGLERVKNHKLPKRVCAPLVEESDVYGRNGDKEAIIQLLLSDDKFSVIPIVGMGGIGKTTLAQLVYNDARVTKMFDTRVWVTVGDDDKVNSSKVMKTIILKVKSAKSEFEEEFEVLNEVKKVLTGKKFLIVLDDVWDEDSNRWEAIKSTFQSGLHGSKIIVTTRSTRVASIMGTKSSSTYFLSTISFDKGWELFVRCAAIDVNSHEYSDLQVIGRKIVEKCNGLPLAIKSLGGLLRGKQNKEDWDDILNNDIWGLYESESVGILPALWLSYFYLPSHLKSCFSYCAIFPKDYEYNEQEMTLLWMGEGLLLPKEGIRNEDMGKKYFKDLISMSFFQQSNEDEEEPTFNMHDLIHDLAIFVSGNFCLTMNNISKCSHKVRHFSYLQQCAKADDPKEFEDLFKAKCLRTLLWEQGPSSDQLRLLKIEDLNKSFPCLRVLSIADNEITKLPDSICNLKYLRYLKLRCRIKEIPNTICKLYNLETLLLEGCVYLTRLPTDIGNLINLRHLSVPKINLVEMPLQLGKLQNLQTLNRFVVGRNRDCGGIELLKEFQDLHGSLSITGLENVNVSRLEEVSDAAAPLLKSKKSLNQLELRWNRAHFPKLDELLKERELLNALQPHPNLKKLSIWHYKGNNFPNWMGDHRCLSNLVSLKMEYCSNCSFLPSLGQLPSLKDLWIRGCGVVRIDSEFYCSSTLDSSSSSVAIQTKPLFFTSLETLAFIDFSELEEWSFMEGGGFPRLKNLQLIWCKRLKVTLLGDYFPSLTELLVYDCDQLIALILPRAQLMQAPLITLKKIEFVKCPNLRHLDEEAFQHLTSLEELIIDQCPNLECLPKELPSSLSELHISNCPLLRPRVERETGEDWPIIAHIPNITVDNGEHSALRDSARLLNWILC
ncbi:putative disease resistance RPP13-like protein 1 [Cannabis sativa]|uniref:putative disease resistance RPP13-like protein 1 n=1 Tax=Cannabis sativa TaxID=3483 RepID=UPI0029CA09AD|nr:putative disease resistance RPP13-like protein 1 [Cannabis sativa]XP_060967415.1 putative disease resistance RPP13-like protein 1 [Cannabis sativa]XP_060967416.1 putative disease resistance RPP13-like protein 1 [Cannabis sativa]XP_060967417.1 putative disease resistance RPP13-like protein 1 [Cannabis sativa]